jgi:hypothetical protein
VPKTVAEARRTQLVSVYGVGSIFPAQEESFMIVGLDDWSDKRCPVVPEPRLARSLGVQTFRMPASGENSRDVPVVRFPTIHHCARCGRLDHLRAFCKWDEHVCHSCQRVLTPSRFVLCCPAGHIEDFPYYQWLHRGQGSPDKEHKLFLKTRGQSSSLADIVISCSCGIPPRTMAGSFSGTAMGGIKKCAGRRPWLRDAPVEECDKLPRTLQRGASNVWFPSVRSAISIPPWSEGVHKLIGQYWPMVEHIPTEALAATLEGMGLPKMFGLPLPALVDAILHMRGESGDVPSDEDLRGEEYQALVLGRPEEDPHQQFVCTEVDGLEKDARRYLASVSEVSRLREVRALRGFTRVLPGGDDDTTKLAPLSLDVRSWLPAVEVLGEGVFVRVDERALERWERTEFALGRAEAIDKAYEVRAKLYGQESPPRVSARELMLHSFAHVLLTELSLDAGYPVASLRERVYARPGQSGILVYTATADSAGSLGGLSAQSQPDRIWSVVRSAVLRSQWCSSDPVCIESTGAGADALNLAACHACLLLPETSCERMNHVLDRATLVGLPETAGVGFFDRFIA